MEEEEYLFKCHPGALSSGFEFELPCFSAAPPVPSLKSHGKNKVRTAWVGVLSILTLDLDHVT